MKINKHQTTVMICAILLSLTTGCATRAPVDKHARNLSASCAACHGTNGNSAGGVPTLAGLDKNYFITQMKDFKSGARTGTIMNKHAKGYSEAEIEKLASYFSAQ
jgi:cytochrome subunit of sulfide dehydrogenase